MYRKIILALFCSTCAATALFATAGDKDETPPEVVKPSSLILAEDDTTIVPAPTK